MAKLTEASIKTVTSLADDDLFYIVDVSDLTHGPNGTSGKIKKSDLINIVNTLTKEDAIVAAGTTQGTATTITKRHNRVDTVPAGSGVVEDATNPDHRVIQNNCGTGEDLKWYPNGTQQFYRTGAGGGLLGSGVPIIIADGNSAAYIRYSANVLTIQG